MRDDLANKAQFGHLLLPLPMWAFPRCVDLWNVLFWNMMDLP